MHLRFLGAAGQVTGSRFLVETGDATLLVDCGMFQERPFLPRNWEPSPVPTGDIDAVLLTHAHLDHCGLLPRLVAEGFEGPIYATPPSIDLARIVLEDAGRIQEEDAAYKRRRHQREGRRGAHPEIPLYTAAEATAALRSFRITPLDRPLALPGGLEARFVDAGHILGAAMILLDVPVGDATRRLVFSGDIGEWDRPLMHDPTLVTHADVVVMESTYGDRDHPPRDDLLERLAAIVRETVDAGGNVVIPTFAIDRAQELLYSLGILARDGRIPRLTIFLDSPMAINATTVYKRYARLLDDDARAMIAARTHPFQFPGLHFVRSAEESRSINSIRGSCIILAGSGMCTGGRIKHHLRQNIHRPECTILFSGYQARDTLGRRILEGETEVRIHGRQYEVHARIERLDGISAHADRSGLLRWLDGFAKPPAHLFLVHGEKAAATALAEAAREKCGDVTIPGYGDQVELFAD